MSTDPNITRAESASWTRHWIAQDGSPEAVRPMANATATAIDTGKVVLSDIADTPCLVLLGEPGMGKTHEIDKLAAWLRSKGELVDLLRGKDTKLPASLDALFASEHHQFCTLHGRPWHILIDGIDEIVGPSSARVQLLSNFLDGLFTTNHNINSLRIVLTCRSAAWNEDLDQVIEQRWPIGSFRKLTLAPLAEADILAAIDLIQPEDAERASLAKLLLTGQMITVASRPLLLFLLLRSHRNLGGFPQGQTDLFAGAVESTLSTPGNPNSATLTSVAGRLAVATTFSGSVQFSPGAREIGPDILPVSRIAGGLEPSSAGSVIATPALLSEVLRTPLFSEIAPDTFQWTHRSFPEYLTGRYLAEHRLSADEILSLLHIPEIGGPGGIAPHMIEVAGWAAAMVPAFFNALLDRQPDILLRSQAAALALSDRAKLTDALLKRFSTGELLDQYDELVPLFVTLSHPGLAEQLRPTIIDPLASTFERRAAIDIAAEAGVVELTQDLICLAGELQADGLIRSMAARAVVRLHDADAARLLAPLLQGNFDSDTEDRLRGVLMSVCWPDTLSFNDMLDALAVPKRHNFFGPYQLFLYRFTAPQLTAAEALAALDWLQRRVDSDHRQHDLLEPVMAKMLRAIADRTADPDVRKAFAAFVIIADFELFRLFFADAGGPLVWPEDAEKRTALVLELLVQANGSARASALVRHRLEGLIRPDDLDAYLGILTNAQKSIREPLAQIVVDLAQHQPIDTLNHVWAAALRVPELQRTLTERYSVDLESTNAEYMRASAKREREKKAADEREKDDESAWRTSVADMLGRIEAGRAELWWQLNLKLFHEPSGHYDGSLEFETDLTRTPGWRALGEEEQTRILQSAPVYLRNAPLADTTWLGSRTSHRPANAGLRALRLLYEQDRKMFDELERGVWAIWAPAVLGFFGNDFYKDGNPQRELMRIAYIKAPDAVLSALREMATGTKSEGLTSRVLELFDGLLDAPLSDLLEELLNADNLKGNDAPGQVIAYLVRNGDPRATRLVHDALLLASATSDPDAAGTPWLEKGVIALLNTELEETWFEILGLREKNETLARTIWTSVAQYASFEHDFRFDALSEYALAQAFIDLAVLLPERPPEVLGARVLGDPDYVEQMRSTLLSLLISSGTNASLEQLHRVRDTLPDWHKALNWSIAQARRNVRSKALHYEIPTEILARIGAMGVATEKPEPVVEPDASKGDEARDDSEDVPSAVDIPIPAPVPSGLLSSGDRRTILTVATEWASHHGGISTLNRELCAALASIGHTVFCLVPEADPNDFLEAKKVLVTLVQCPASVQIEGTARFLLCELKNIGPKPDLVIGHDHITGPAARALASRFDAKYVHFLHTIPHENEGLKTPHADAANDPLRGEAKLEDQIELARQADLVVAVGPRIKRSFLSEASLSTVTMLIPGLSADLLKLAPNHKNLYTNACLMSGRMEDAGVKGGRLACDIIKKVANDRMWRSGQTPKLVMRGFTKAKAEAEFAKIGDFKTYAQFVQLRSFSTDRAQLHNELLNSALIIMPSIAEGFGLTGLEAIAAGVPVIISAESGLAEYLRDPDLNEGLDLQLVEPCVAPVAQADGTNCDAWAAKVDAALFDHEAAFTRAAKLRSALRTQLAWDNAARKLSNDFLAL